MYSPDEPENHMAPKNINPANDPNTVLAELTAKLKAMEEENTKLKAQANKVSAIRLKVSEKGGLSLYGMGRFPITLYAAQWERLLDESVIGSIRVFLKENAGQFSTKEDAKARTQAQVSGPGVTDAKDVGQSNPTNVPGDKVTAPASQLKVDLKTGKTIGPSGNAF